jgi:hypothetical protein
VPEDDAMQDDSRKGALRQAEALGPDTIEARMRTRIRETIEAIVEEELEAALGAETSARVGAARQGYRHGTRERTLTTSLGPTTFTMPRARVTASDGTTTEWRSATVARYQRRTARVDEALLGVYLDRDQHAAAERGRSPPCCAAGPCRRTRYRAWWGGCATTSRRGEAGIWRTKMSAMCFWTGGSRKSGSVVVGSVCRFW